MYMYIVSMQIVTHCDVARQNRQAAKQTVRRVVDSVDRWVWAG